MSEEARFWIGLGIATLLQLSTFAAAIVVFFKRAGAGEGRMLGRLDLLNHKIEQAHQEVGKTAAAHEKTAEALWRRAETLESRVNQHGETLAEHKTRLEHLERKRT